MTLNEYLEKHDLDYCDIKMIDEYGKEIEPATLIQYCTVVNVDGNVVTIR